MGSKKHPTCLASLLQNELNSDVARFAIHIKPLLQQIRLFTDLNTACKTCIIAFQRLVLQQCCKANCTFFARFTVSEPLQLLYTTQNSLKIGASGFWRLNYWKQGWKKQKLPWTGCQRTHRLRFPLSFYLPDCSRVVLFTPSLNWLYFMKKPQNLTQTSLWK